MKAKPPACDAKNHGRIIRDDRIYVAVPISACARRVVHGPDVRGHAATVRHPRKSQHWQREAAERRSPADALDFFLSGRERLKSKEWNRAVADFEAVLIDDGYPGAVVTAIFQPAQSFEQDRGGRFFANIANDSTHKIAI